jgi:membrane protease subunit HflK
MALNDPQWGRRGNAGPPDLDELWNRLRQRFPGVLGKGGGRGEAGNGGGRPVRAGVWVLVALVVLVWLASGFYIVDASQKGVVLRFGKYDRTTEPGPQWNLPYPIESREVVNVSQVRTVELGYRSNVKNKVLKESLMLTDDENIIDLQFAVQYLISDPRDYLFNNRFPDDTVLQVAESAMREVVGKSKMDFVAYEGREQVAIRAQELIQSILDRYKTGIRISRVTMQQAQPPEQVQAAFDDAVRANQDRERQINEGQAYSNDVVPKARGTASRLLQEAEGYRARVIANAEGDAARFRQILTEYSRAPAVTRERMYLDAMQQIYSTTSKVLIDQKAGNSLLFLPLEKLLQMSAAGALPSDSERASASETPSSTGTGPADPRSRDALRGREREARP